MEQFHLVGALWASLCLLNICASPAHATPVSGQGTWESTLEGRDLDGNAATFEAYYDTVLNITWLADADLAFTSGFDDNGRMIWEDANAWAAGLDVNGVTGWRLPTLGPIDGNSFIRTFPINDGTSDMGWTWTTTDGSDGGWRDIDGNPVSELGHMFYVHLGNLGFYIPDCSAAPEECVQAGYGLANTGPFSNVSDGLYWCDIEWGPDAGWNFYTGHGRQKHSQKWRQSHAWAVRDGDTAAALLRCDLNDNGEVDAGDLSQVLRMVFDDIADDLDCDINNGGSGDGVISVADIVVITRIVQGIIPAIYK